MCCMKQHDAESPEFVVTRSVSGESGSGFLRSRRFGSGCGVKNNHLLSAPQSAHLPFPGFCRTCLRDLAARSLSVIGPVERRSGGSVSPREEVLD